MACEFFKAPPQTAVFKSDSELPSGAHAYAEAYRAECAANGTPLGTFKRDVLQSVPIVAQFTHHNLSNGVPGCYNAVTLFRDTAPPGTPGGVASPAIDWVAVAASAGAAAVVVTAFVLALRYAGRHDQKRR